MAYDALVAKWATLSGTTAEKIAEVNALTIAGPNVDVAVSTVVGKLILSGAYLPLAAFSQSAPTGSSSTHDTALGAAKMLMAVISIPNAPAFQMSDTASNAAIKGMMDAILAQETASAGSTGFTQAVHDTLIGLCATTVPWVTTPVSAGGAGLAGSVDIHTLTEAGLS